MKTITARTRDAAGGEGMLGLVCLVLAFAFAGVYFREGIATLIEAWQLAEYSHGPLIPLLSGFLFLRQLKTVPPRHGDIPNRWPGVALVVFAMLIALVGKFAHIGDIVAYAMILWIGGMVLISFGWKQGREFWPPVLHLCFMLPLPGLFYYKVSTVLQFMSSELGVWVLQVIGTPVFLDGNIIDLGIYRLHVAEACSGLRYLFPIMSFSYIFAVLYRGPTWHKAVLLLSAVPLAVFMNSARIALVGVLVNNYGIDQAEGFAHLMEGWVVFLSCILIMFLLAWLMLALQPAPRMSLPEALDLDFDEIMPQFQRLLLTRPSRALITAMVLLGAGAAAWQVADVRVQAPQNRLSLASFPRQIGDWQAEGPAAVLEPGVAKTLAANDYLSQNYVSPGESAAVSFFSAWYLDQTKGGIHSPEICLPGGGWEMERIEVVDLAGKLGTIDPFPVNRALIRKGMTELLVYYWFDQSGRRIASDYKAKMMLLWSGATEGRTDGALVRLTTPVLPGESADAAEARLLDFLRPAMDDLPDHIDHVGAAAAAR